MRGLALGAGLCIVPFPKCFSGTYSVPGFVAGSGTQTAGPHDPVGAVRALLRKLRTLPARREPGPSQAGAVRHAGFALHTSSSSMSLSALAKKLRKSQETIPNSTKKIQSEPYGLGGWSGLHFPPDKEGIES